MSRRDEVRKMLRGAWDGMSGRHIAEALQEDYEKVYDDLKNLRNRGEVSRDERGLWFWALNSIVPEGVGLRREPKAHPLEHALVRLQADKPMEFVDEPQEIVELAEHLDRISVVPAEELDKPAVDWQDRDQQPDIEIKMVVPLWVARRVFDVLEATSREAKAK